MIHITMPDMRHTDPRLPAGHFIEVEYNSMGGKHWYFVYSDAEPAKIGKTGRSYNEAVQLFLLDGLCEVY